MYKFDREAYDRRMEWYRDARFGMFIHWGLYAIPARGEWVRSTEQIPKEDYMKYFEEFNPVDFEPRKWAKAAKEAGMKYMVLTAKLRVLRSPMAQQRRVFLRWTPYDNRSIQQHRKH